MPTLKELYEFSIVEGMKEDPRGEDIKNKLLESKEKFEKLSDDEKELFDKDKLWNPFDDTRVLFDTGEDVNTIMVGIDIEAQEVLLADRLREKGVKIDALIAHHPEGSALSGLYGVMDMQVSTLTASGVPVAHANACTRERLNDVNRGVSGINHTRTEETAKFLGISLACFHTVTDNHVHTFLAKLLESEKPKTVRDIYNILIKIPEYRWAVEKNAGLKLFNGSMDNPVGKIHLEMTGGTEGSEKAYEKLANAGVGTIVAMHMGDKQFEEAKKNNLNVFIAGHMASDSLGMNLLLDKIENQFGIKIIECSGFKRIKRA